MDCPSGRYQTEDASASCLPCIPGKFKADAGKTECVDCDANTFSKLAGSSSCKDCGIGENSEEGSAKCSRCGAGTYGSDSNGCLSCPVKTARNSSDPDLTQCRQCKLGETTTIVGAAVCDKW